MASLRPKGNSFFVRFRLGGRQFERDVGRDPAKAEATLKRVEATVLDIKNGRIKLPDDADIAQFIVSDGETTAKPKLPEILTLADLFQRFEEALPEGAMEPNSLTMHRIHRKHLTRILGAKVAAETIGTAELQSYINKRCKEGRERDTIKKEVSTFGSIWTWATLQNLLTGPCRTRGLKYPKAKDKPPPASDALQTGWRSARATDPIVPPGPPRLQLLSPRLPLPCHRAVPPDRPPALLRLAYHVVQKTGSTTIRQGGPVPLRLAALADNRQAGDPVK
jgi:hypothetical protein